MHWFFVDVCSEVRHGLHFNTRQSVNTHGNVAVAGVAMWLFFLSFH
jgi:hypothetical protein